MFASKLISAAEEAFKAGEISRMDMFRLRINASRPRKMRRLEEILRQQATAEGLTPDEFIAALRKWLTAILEILDLLDD